MKYRVVILPRAREEMQEAANWYRERSRSSAVAAKWLRGFMATLRRLNESPERFPLARESDLFPSEIRELHYGSGRRITHRALFVVRGEVVEVWAIRHIAQDDVTPESL